MKPFFTVMRKADGKTDYIYSFNFKTGEFYGGADVYSYDDVDYFIGLPAEFLKALFIKPEKAKKEIESEPIVVD